MAIWKITLSWGVTVTVGSVRAQLVIEKGFDTKYQMCESKAKEIGA